MRIFADSSVSALIVFYYSRDLMILAAFFAKYVKIPSAPARLMQISDSIKTASWLSQSFCAAAMCIAYSPLT
jgi:hypothetical protein